MKNNVNVVNKKAKFDYEFVENFISGIVLFGSEVKQIREGKISFLDSFCVFNDGEFYLKNSIIQQTETDFSHLANRDRKLLLTKQELKKIHKHVKKGLTAIPYKVFTNERGLIKVEIAIAKGKKQFDKRETIKKREVEKNLKRVV